MLDARSVVVGRVAAHAELCAQLAEPLVGLLVALASRYVRQEQGSGSKSAEGEVGASVGLARRAEQEADCENDVPAIAIREAADEVLRVRLADDVPVRIGVGNGC